MFMEHVHFPRADQLRLYAVNVTEVILRLTFKHIINLRFKCEKYTEKAKCIN